MLAYILLSRTYSDIDSYYDDRGFHGAYLDLNKAKSQIELETPPFDRLEILEINLINNSTIKIWEKYPKQDWEISWEADYSSFQGENI